MFVLDISSLDLSGKDAEKVLEEIGISVSRSTIPNDPRPPFNPSGLRLGVPAITTRGLKEDDTRKVAKLVDKALRSKDNMEDIKYIRGEVIRLCQRFPLKY